LVLCLKHWAVYWEEGMGGKVKKTGQKVAKKEKRSQSLMVGGGAAHSKLTPATGASHRIKSLGKTNQG